ncbi:MAG TPA: cytochrome c oxidase subunit II [Croceibacterium sp.]|nr:cytochrome c oxidase subunit II [Croceibacterium sp.]
MKFGDIARKWLHVLPFLAAVMALISVPQTGIAQAVAEAPAASVADANTVPAAAGESPATEAVAAEASAYKPLGPEWIKGQPTAKAITFQEQYSPIGEEALFMHDAFLLPMMVAVSLLVLGLLLWVTVRFRRGRNPVPSKTSHNTMIEVLWTAIPVVILVIIAIPSITLLANQYKSPPKDALTVKVTGYQWYWGYSYPDNGGFEVISNMLPEEDAVARGEPSHLAVDNRLVVPAGEPIRLQVTGADVIHSFAVPSLWFKIDAVPGRLNERLLFIKEPGIYYGQCSELCGARHGYMPIAVEALPRAQFDAYVLSKGGTLGGEEDVAAPAAAAPAPEAAASEAPAEGAPEAGATPAAEA